MNKNVTFQSYKKTIESLPKAVKLMLSFASAVISVLCICLGIIYLWKFDNYIGLLFLTIGVGATVSGFVYIKSINKSGR
jgi:hypothetical protein